MDRRVAVTRYPLILLLLLWPDHAPQAQISEEMLFRFCTFSSVMALEVFLQETGQFQILTKGPDVNILLI